LDGGIDSGVRLRGGLAARGAPQQPTMPVIGFPREVIS